MKPIRLITILTIALCLTQACKTLKLGKGTKGSFNTQLTVFQNGTENPISNLSETIEIDKTQFSLRFYNKKYDSENKKFYSAQIAAFRDKSELDKLITGLSMSASTCFSPGSGMAANRSNKYTKLILNNRGHHYAPYKNTDSKRVNLLEDTGKLLKLEFEINSLYYDNKEVKMTETELKEFYLAFLIDKNLNGIIDKGELNKVTIKIK
jgi:N-methylhydantoinase B/oxoprolinase/acetone carboxylase alpha subunit